MYQGEDVFIAPFFYVKPFITFYYPCMVEKILFLSQIFQTEILMDSQVLGFPQSENKTFRDWSVRMRVSVSVCYQHYPKTNHSKNSKFCILHLYRVDAT